MKYRIGVVQTRYQGVKCVIRQFPNQVPNGVGKRKVKKKKFEDFQQSHPLQLQLFELLEETDVISSPKSPKKASKYSQSIELYDFMPKYVWKTQSKARRKNGGFLPMLERDFECRGIPYRIVIHPAGILDQETKESKYYYPGITEEIVEDVLRKLAVEKGGVFLDDQAGVEFSISQIRKELKAIGHNRSHYEVKRALEILALTRIELIHLGQKHDKIIFSPIENLGVRGDDDETHTFVVFSPLVTESIKKMRFRLYNYRQVMSYKSLIARQLHKRMAHHYTQASITTEYKILITTLIRDFGLTQQASLGKNVDDLEYALEEMVRARVILRYKIETIFDAKNPRKLVDAMVEIVPTVDFSGDVKKANFVETRNKIKFPVD